ncbi:MAG: 50S ribosomal protein L18 [Gammaproteobacteria bacterium]|nr:50S ribosomal protein L18 [Gammaproteobacteria bacterium]
MHQRKIARLRRARKTREQIKRKNIVRLSVFRSPRHIYAQLINDETGRVLANASTLDPEVRTAVKSGGNIEAASVVGKAIAGNAKAAGITRVGFDRSGFKYHGRVKALAEAAREHGLEF